MRRARGTGHRAPEVGRRGRRRILRIALGLVLVLGFAGHAAAGLVADPAKVAGEELRRDRYPEILVPAAIGWARLFGDDIVNRNPVAEARTFGRRPFQVVHGTADRRSLVHNATDFEAVL